MKRTGTALLIVLLWTSMVHAEDKIFWTLAAGAQAAAVYDAETTLKALRRCPSCYEANPIMRPFVGSRSGAYGATMGFSALSTYGSRELKKRGSRWWWAPMVGQIGLHTALAIRNSRLR
jgi:hypothetical protein